MKLTIATILCTYAFIALTPTPSLAQNTGAGGPITDCVTFQRWFARQPGSKLVLSSTSSYENSVRPRTPDTILNYSAFPLSPDRASWYKNMKHFRTNVGNGGCLSGFFDSTRNTALIYSQYGTASDLTITTISSPPTGLPIHPVPNQTRNGVRVGMTLAQVKATEGPGTLRSDGHYQRLTYNQNFKTPSSVAVTAYLGFLFMDDRLVAVDVGGGL